MRPAVNTVRGNLTSNACWRASAKQRQASGDPAEAPAAYGGVRVGGRSSNTTPILRWFTAPCMHEHQTAPGRHRPLHIVYFHPRGEVKISTP